MRIENKLKELGLSLPEAPEGGGTYGHVRLFDGKLAFVAGCGPELDSRMAFRGRAGVEVTIEEGRLCARDCILNTLRALQLALGDLDRVKRFLKMTVYVACPPEFQDGPKVADGATELLAALYGPEAGMPVRTTVGVNALTEGFPVELDVIAEVE